MTNFNWRPATGLDLEKILDLSEQLYEENTAFNPNRFAYSRHISLAIINQFYLPTSTLFSVATDKDNNLLAYTWADTNEVAPWSDERFVSARMAHVDKNLSNRTKVKLVCSMLVLWEEFAKLAQVSIIISNTMRRDQDGFLKLHAKNGYDVRGSYAYKRLF